jgi:hypothetical protein
MDFRQVSGKVGEAYMAARSLIALSAIFIGAPLAAAGGQGSSSNTPINRCGVGAVHVCPTDLRKDSKATLTLGAKHPKEFAIRRPDATWVYLAVAGEWSESIAEFATLSRFEFVPRDLTGFDFGKGRQPVFTVPGQYLFYFADNVETERDNTYWIDIAVKYRP